MDLTKSATKGFQDAFKLGSPGQASPAVIPTPDAAVPADESARSTVSRDALPDVTNPQATLDAATAAFQTHDGDNALTNAQAIPDDVAEAMRSTPALIQELTKQVRESSDNNAKVVQQAIMNQ
jgi:hypothetical protein